MRDAKLFQIYEGTSQIQRLVIAKEIYLHEVAEAPPSAFVGERLQPLPRCAAAIISAWLFRPLGHSAKSSVRCAATRRLPPRVRQSPPPDCPAPGLFLAVVRRRARGARRARVRGVADKLAAGTTIAGVDVGGLSGAQAARLLSAPRGGAEEHAGHVHRRRASRSRSPRPSSGRSRLGAAVATAAAEGGGFGPLRGFRRLQVRFFGVDVAPPLVLRRGRPLQARPDRARGRPEAASTPRSCAGARRSGRRGHDGPRARPRRGRRDRRPRARDASTAARPSRCRS